LQAASNTLTKATGRRCLPIAADVRKVGVLFKKLLGFVYLSNNNLVSNQISGICAY